MYVRVLSACLCMHSVNVWSPQRSEIPWNWKFVAAGYKTGAYARATNALSH